MIKNWFGNVGENGILLLDEQNAFENHARKFSGKRVILTLRQYRKQRSNNQNRYYWGVVIHLLSEDTGETPERIHDAMRLKFLLRKGKKFPILKSSSELNTSEFEDYLSKIRSWASVEMGINIPEPHEVTFEY